MSDWKGKCTRGIYEIHRKNKQAIVSGNLRIAGLFTGGVFGADSARTISEKEAESNAMLFAEAGNVLNETNLTPREILEQRDELLAALRDLLSDTGIKGTFADKARAAIARVAGEQK